MPFEAILKEDIERKIAKIRHGRQPVRKRSFVKAATAGLLLGYARVSKGDEQSNALQAKALSAAGCRRIFEEAASGGRWDRPSCTACSTSYAKATVVVWKLDRLSRSLKDVLHIMERIGEAGAGFRSITETSTPRRRGPDDDADGRQLRRVRARHDPGTDLRRPGRGTRGGPVGGRRKKLDAAKRREIAESVITGRKSGADMARLYNISHRPCHGSSPSTGCCRCKAGSIHAT